VTDCPARVGKLTTETISLYTTVCPVSAASPAPPTPTATTEIIYTTEILTITSCPAEVTNCPARYSSTTTTVYPVSSTVVVISTSAPVVAPSTLTSAAVPATKTAVGTISGSGPSNTTSLPLQVTGAAGRLAGGMEIAFVAAGVVGVAFL